MILGFWAFASHLSASSIYPRCLVWSISGWSLLGTHMIGFVLYVFGCLRCQFPVDCSLVLSPNISVYPFYWLSIPPFFLSCSSVLINRCLSGPSSVCASSPRSLGSPSNTSLPPRFQQHFVTYSKNRWKGHYGIPASTSCLELGLWSEDWVWCAET